MAADSQDEDGRTPLFWAADRGHEEVVKLLKQKMKDASNIPGSSIANTLDNQF